MEDTRELALVILAIIDDEKRLLVPEGDFGDVRELRMQLREVAFSILGNKKVTREDLH